jgi:glyoxylase I family protein
LSNQSLVKSIDHCSLIVNNTQRALGFYRDILGLKVDNSRPKMAYDGAWLTVGDGQIHLLELPNPDPVTGRPDHGGRDRHVALAVSSLDTIVARLKTAKIPFTLSKSGRKALFCRDHDGNAIEMVEK